MDVTQKANQIARDALAGWQADIKKNVYTRDHDYIHTLKFHFPQLFVNLHTQLKTFGSEVANELDALVSENNLAANLPRLEAYNAIGERIDKVRHHPSYVQAGDLIYQTKLMEKMSQPGGLSGCLAILFLSSQIGEAGHNCPIACSAGILRVLQKVPDFPQKEAYLERLISPAYQTNFTGAQFLTEIQGGSDVGLNAACAQQDEKGLWRIYGEKWFCSNAGADLIFVTARYDKNLSGTKGLGLFLVAAEWEGKKNHYTLRRLKDKIGTRSMATGEIDFQGAYALPMGELQDGIHLVMDNVLHLSRLFNTVCVLGMARRAYFIALSYAQHRVAFSHPILSYPLVSENLARIKAENTAMIAACFATIKMQDQLDMEKNPDNNAKLLLRLLVNCQKYLSARWSVEHIHHALDVLAGNGTIESFSSIPRLLRDCIVCENWEGTHNVLRAQILKDIVKYHIDEIYLTYMQTQIKQLDPNHALTQTLISALTTFRQDLASFRQRDTQIQMLEIQLIVDSMAILFCALMLLLEAHDQLAAIQSSAKMTCCEYFFLLHLHEKPISYTENYLKLITKINHDATFISDRMAATL